MVLDRKQPLPGHTVTTAFFSDDMFKGAAMTVARYVIHKMIQDLLQDRERAALFAKNPEPIFDEYALLPHEREAIRDGSIAALNELGVHPNLQMKLGRLRNPAAIGGSAASPLVAYLDRIMVS